MKMYSLVRTVCNTRLPYGALFSFRRLSISNQARHLSHPRNVGILGVPFCKGQARPGTDKGPAALRAGKLVKELQGLGITVKDYGDVTYVSGSDNTEVGLHVKNAPTVAYVTKKVSEAVSQILSDGRTCVTLGGDHSIGMATVHGHAQVYKNVSVIWVDAHADINTAGSTPSGNMHGMPCSFIVKEMQRYCVPVPGFEFLQPCVDARNLIFIGLRDVDPLERLFLDKLNILTFSMREIDQLGIFRVIEQTLDRVEKNGADSVHVSFDIDAVDKMYAPSTGTPVHGGLSIREAFCIAEEFSKLGNLHGLDMVEVNPQLGTSEEVQRTVDLASEIIAGFFGRHRKGNLPLDHT